MAKNNDLNIVNNAIIDLIGRDLFALFELKKLRQAIALMKSVNLNKKQRRKMYIKFNQLTKNKGSK